MEGYLTMSNREIDRLKVIQNTIAGKLTWPQAAEILSLSERQVGRLCAQVREEGNRGVVHGLKRKCGKHNAVYRNIIQTASCRVEKRFF